MRESDGDGSAGRESREGERPGDESAAEVPEKAFEVLGDETRLAIVQELAARRRTAWRMDGLRFAELRKAVGVRDAGTFSYHLDRLQDRFVTKRGEEYVLTTSGLAIADAILAGWYGDDVAQRRTETGRDCPDCDRTLAAIYRHGLVGLECDEHGLAVATSLPPGAVAGREMDEVLRIAFRDVRHDIQRALDGVCFHCWGPMRTTLAVEPPLQHPATGEPIDADPFEDGGVVTFGCERCGTVFWVPPAARLLDHPAVVAFAHDHGVDLPGDPFVGLAGDASDRTTVVDDEPPGVRVTVAVDDARLHVTLDGDADVASVERE